MELLLANSSLDTPGGSETYLITVALQLQRLGHDVTMFGLKLGQMADAARDQGLRVTDSLSDLTAPPDVALSQDAVVSYELADRYPGTPQLFRACSALYDFQLPPNLPGLIDKVIVLSDRVAARVRATGQQHELVRLRQPVDTERFKPLSPIREVPRRAVLLGNYLNGQRRRTLISALDDLGIDATQIGAGGRTSLGPEHAIARADIVIAKGRSAIEGMACGRAVLVYDEFGSDGWVTPERYEAMEADNFAGQAGNSSAGRLRAELCRYNPEMGLVNRELALRHHGARHHANELAGLLSAANSGQTRKRSSILELARLARMQWQTENKVHGLERALGELEAEYRKLEDGYRRLENDWRHQRAILSRPAHRWTARVRAAALRVGRR